MDVDPDLSDVRAALAAQYRIEQEIGHGGTSRVYRAYAVAGGPPVAIKVLRAELAAAVIRDRFRREIALATTLHHPNILPILASDELGGLLFYVMPYVEGETLRQRLLRERQLPLPDAVRITREIAAGLAEAHRQGVVHRDIKPENILFSEGRAVVADFGIARAISEAAGDRLTSTGIAIGTPGYMSPEQAAGDRTLNHRTDIYSLGCVLYEMLAGEMPYAGPSAQVILAKQVGLPTPSVRITRDTVPMALDRVLQRALAKVPADRYASVEEFAAAVTAADRPPTWIERARMLSTRRGTLIGGGLLALSALAWFLVIQPKVAPAARTTLDTTRYLVLPLEQVDTLLSRGDAEHLLHDALVRWRGVGAVDTRRVEEALRGRSVQSLGTADAAGMARDLGAGRVLRASSSPVGDSLRLRVALYDAAGADTLLEEQIIRMSTGEAHRDSLVAAAVDYVLFRGTPPNDAPSPRTTLSLPARQAFAAGTAALEQWHLARADSEFAAAVTADPEYAQAQLWLALARAWGDEPVARWRVPAEQAVLGAARLDSVDAGMAAAILDEAKGDRAHACDAWGDVTRADQDRFAAWYGLARCLATDPTVLRDPASPSGWRFRTSYHAALLAYQRAFQLEPSILASFRPRSFQWLRYLFKTSGHTVRAGRALPPDTLVFVSDAAWTGDTLAFVPHSVSQPMPRPATKDEAVRRLREMFRDVAMTWVAAAPHSAPALEALALSLAMVGDRAALDTLGRAAALATGSADRFRVANAEVWMRLGFGLPDDGRAIAEARRLADSLLAHPPPDDEEALASLENLAALTGRAHAAAANAIERRVREEPDEPLELRRSAPALLVFAALGGPVDSLRALEPRVRSAIAALPVQSREQARANWLIRPATMAFPVYRFPSATSLAASDRVLELQVAWSGRDTAAVRRGLENRRRQLRGISPSDLTLDGLYPEAELLFQIGAPELAAAWLDPTLGALAAKGPDGLASPVEAACLVRSMALRATIADRLHDRATARRWASAVVALWSDADAFLQPLVTRQRTLLAP